MIKITLRNLVETDLPTLFEHQRDAVANLMATFPAREENDFRAHWAAKVLGNQSVVKKAILVDEQLTGYICSWEQSEKHLLGYWIGKEYWGQGIATKALGEFLKALVHRPLYAYVAKHNVGSIRVLEKCGFTVTSHGTFFSKVHGHDVEEVLMMCK